MTCKDCIYEPQCLSHHRYGMGTEWDGKYITDIETRCNSFKNKADVVKVVRCKECVHWSGVTLGNVCKRWSSPLEGLKNCTTSDDYCSYAEKKGGAEKCQKTR